ncbi:MAG TPA: hydrolase 1, exosortase A system-associated [Burkholderiaceae bacterium]|jgi:exosortase A-associated hydrolase 1
MNFKAANFEERAVHFACAESWLCGIVSVPEQAFSRGAVIVVGGPQYRVGSHRQFTLLARHLATQGVPVMRFDYRGMGDSQGDARTFESIDDDLRCAIDQFIAEVPQIKEVVLWGLCDAASAALFYAYQDQRVTGLVLLNPWVRTEEGIAKATLKHYYTARLFERDLWQKILRGRFDYGATIKSAMALVSSAFLHKKSDAAEGSGNAHQNISLPDRMYHGLNLFKGRTLVILSGNDLTGKEFSDLIKGSKKWQKLISTSNVQRHELDGANHTFSRREWRDQVVDWTCKWVKAE